ncbi:maltase-glucoamylase, intestinal-like [Choloepus didactylus]|uniref:maltase-glucoamylase, intestinal-like n=1 Tax=Choloepus didactylus TaxID=27675 RepID=UPI00189CAF63|nr:maltase-glucoamylase, intestinal-like [Choloepus didactylus]
MSRQNPFGLIIALDEQEEAYGSFFWDDGDSIDSVEKEAYFYAEYKFSDKELRTTIIKHGYSGIADQSYDTVQILGLSAKPDMVSVNGKSIPRDRIEYYSNKKINLWISEPFSQELTISVS